VLLTGALGSFGRAQALRRAAASARMFLLDRPGPGHQNGETFAVEVTRFGGESATFDRQSVKERMQPEHVTDLVLFLCASASDMITGQNIAIDGGW
jgi:NAD(P)-dependent dehydrogenase (short-subunit alcohol dehydrogenase family)